MSISATLIVCDDIRAEANGKLFIIGVYTGDLVIPHEDFQIFQLMFLFSLDAPIDEAPQKVTFSVTLPGEEPALLALELPLIAEKKPEHTRWYLRQVVLVQNNKLKSGHIETTVNCDGKDIPIGGPWIVIQDTVTDPGIVASPNI